MREGYTTGACLTGAIKAALLRLTGQPVGRSVTVNLPGKRRLDLELHRLDRIDRTRAIASIIKDAGDDPDLTDGAEVGAEVALNARPGAEPGLRFFAGRGVGTITRPGLPLAPGEPAINPGPRRMAARAAEEALAPVGGLAANSVEATAFVTNGEELAGETLNPRLGIVGGVSILGTTGRVKPYSHAAYRASIMVSLRAAKAQGLGRVVLATGSSSEREALDLLGGPEAAYILVGDFPGFSVRSAAEEGVPEVIMAAKFAKAYKLSLGAERTRFNACPMDLAPLSRWTGELTGDGALAAQIGRANTARHALELLQAAGADAVIKEIGRRAGESIKSWAGAKARTGLVIFDPEGVILYEELCL